MALFRCRNRERPPQPGVEQEVASKRDAHAVIGWAGWAKAWLRRDHLLGLLLRFLGFYWRWRSGRVLLRLIGAASGSDDERERQECRARAEHGACRPRGNG